jgi:putative ABC transport system permease protein
MSRFNAAVGEARNVFRTLARSPRYTLASVLMLALGLGLSVASFSVLDGLLLKSLPLRDGESIRILEARNPSEGIEGAQFTTDEAEALTTGVAGFERIAYYVWYSVGVFDGERARNLTAHVVGPGYFEALGVDAVLGRTPSDEDIREGRAVAVLSHAEWQREFGGSAAVIGRRLELIDEPPLEVIGVLPPAISVFSGDADLWRPLPVARLPQGEARRTNRFLMLVGRLSGGVSESQAAAALEARMAMLPRGASETGWQVSTTSLLDLLVGNVRGAIWGALGLSLLVLGIGATNFALLLGLRQVERQRDEAILRALGASPSRLTLAVLIELAVVSGAALIVGTGLAFTMVALARAWMGATFPRAGEIAIDPGVLGLAVALGLMVPLLVMGLAVVRRPAADFSVIRAQHRLGPVGASRWLPGVAVALATVSVVTAFAMGSSLWKLQQIDPGYRAESVRVLQIFRVGQEAFVPFADGLLEALAEIPGVEEVALASAVPLSDIGSESVDLRHPGRSEPALQQAGLRKVSPGYREVLGIPLLAGRDFDERDRHGAPRVALLSETAARRLFNGQSPLGRTIQWNLGRGGWAEHEIVGVIGDIRNRGLRETPAPELLVPFAQSPRVGMSFLVRGSGDAGLDSAIRGTLHRLDPRQPVTAQFALDEALREQISPVRLFAVAASVFSLLALLLAALGLYALASMEQRRRLAEYGLRSAVGAGPRHLVLHALRGSARVSAAGVAAGALGVSALVTLVDLGAFGLAPGVPGSALILGGLAMGCVALLAGLLPSIRAARTDPMTVLRHD